MSHAHVRAEAAASKGRCGAFAVALVLLGLFASGARAELLGTHPHRDGTVQLRTNLCQEDNPGAGQGVRQRVGARERRGCWQVDGAGNPVVTWSDGSELVLDQRKVKLSRRMAKLLEDSTEASRPGAAPPDHARPAWCPQARFPHERLVCIDAELADRDLRLASLWRPYRRTLSPAAQVWHKSDYFRRLKACGADKACIVSQQEVQMQRYREALHQD